MSLAKQNPFREAAQNLKAARLILQLDEIAYEAGSTRENTLAAVEKWTPAQWECLALAVTRKTGKRCNPPGPDTVSMILDLLRERLVSHSDSGVWTRA